MADLGRAALVVSLGLLVYALLAGGYAAWANKRRLATSARNALVCSFASTAVAAAVLASALVRRGAHEPHPAEHLFPERVLGWAGGIAPAVAPRPDRVRRAGGDGQQAPTARPRRMGRAGARGHRNLLRVRSRGGREPVRHPDGAARRSRPDAEPPEPVHGRAPAAPLPGLRRPVDSVRVRRRCTALRAYRRALDRRDEAVDSRGLDVPRLR